MEAFYGGQIKEEYRGNLVAVVNRSVKGDPLKHCVFLSPIDSDEFIYLTGVGSVKMPVERVYMSISQKAGELAVKNGDGSFKDETHLKSLDSLLVISYFLKKD